MKKLFFALTALSLLATMNSCKPDETDGGGNSAALTVEQKNRALVAYVGHSGVFGPTGSDAATNFPIYNDVVASTATSSIVGITYQPVLINNNQPVIPFLQPFFYKDNNDTPFVNLLSNGLLSHMNPPTTGFPINYFYSCGSNLSSIASKADILGNANGYVSNTPEVGIAVKASAAGNTINIDYKAKAFAPEAGAEYYVSVLVIEKNGNTRQAVAASTFNNIATRNIVRTSAIIANGTGGLKTPVVGLPQTDYTGISPTFGSSAAAASEVEKKVSATYKPLTSNWETIFGENYSNWKFNASNTAVVAIVWKWYPSENKAFYSNCVYADVK